MGGTRKVVVLALSISALLGGVVYVFPNLVAMGLWLLIVPGLVLGILPTLFLYQFAAAVPWLLFYKKIPFLSYLLPVATVLGIAVLGPKYENGRLDALVAAEKARNQLPPGKLVSIDSLALPVNSRAEHPSCGYFCQTILLNRVAKEVVFKTAPNGGEDVAFRLAPKSECDYKETKKLLQQDYLLDPASLAPVTFSTHLRLAEGYCILSGAPSSPKSSLELRWVEELSSQMEVRGIELIAPGQWRARATQTYAPRIVTPLFLEPIGSGTQFNAWRWATWYTPREETTILTYLSQVTRFNLGLPPQPTIEDVRNHIDDLLENPSRSSASFLLVEDYQRLLRDVDAAGDAKRVARLIADVRLKNFEILENASWKQVPDVIVDALIRRLGRHDKMEEGEIYLLQAIAARLPKGTYANGRLAEVFVDLNLARHSEKLLPRVAEEGPSAAPKLLAIIKKGLAQSDTNDRLWGKDVEYAAKGLCRLGPQASSTLPELLELTERYSQMGVTKSPAWLGALVALGHPSGAIPIPASWQRPQFEASLRSYVANCSK